MHITFVKKIKADGTECRKCIEVQSRLEKDGYIEKINTVVIADENDENSMGLKLAKEYEVEQAPFFIVEDDENNIAIYTVYFKFIKEIFSENATENDIAKDILDSVVDVTLNQERTRGPVAALNSSPYCDDGTSGPYSHL